MANHVHLASNLNSIFTWINEGISLPFTAHARGALLIIYLLE